MDKVEPSVLNTFRAAAYVGSNWLGRESLHVEELGTIWSHYAIKNEYSPLEAVLVHRPGSELNVSRADADRMLMLDEIDVGLAQAQHDAMTEIYGQQGIQVHLVKPENEPLPNQMFCADLCAMTPQGAILGRAALQFPRLMPCVNGVMKFVSLLWMITK